MSNPTSNQHILHQCGTPCFVCENERLRAAAQALVDRMPKGENLRSFHAGQEVSALRAVLSGDSSAPAIDREFHNIDDIGKIRRLRAALAALADATLDTIRSHPAELSCCSVTKSRAEAAQRFLSADEPPPETGVNDWQSVETAPLDGTEVLVIGTCHNMLVPNPHRHVASYQRGWWSGRDVLSHVTHWMPLRGLPGSPAETTPPQSSCHCGTFLWEGGMVSITDENARDHHIDECDGEEPTENGSVNPQERT